MDFIDTKLLFSFPGFIIVAAGLLVALAAEGVVGTLVDRANMVIRPPQGIHEDEWNMIITPAVDVGREVGNIERCLYFLAIMINQPELIAVILALKVASKWDSRNTIVKVPENMRARGIDQVDYLRARSQWGARIYQRFSIGTLANLMFAVVAVIFTIVMLEYFKTMNYI